MTRAKADATRSSSPPEAPVAEPAATAISRVEKFLAHRRLGKIPFRADDESAPSGLFKLFGDLDVRPKLIVLHNLFFLVLACTVYWSIMPSFERRVAAAKTREVAFLLELFSTDRPLRQLPGAEVYDLREGSADALAIPGDIRAWLDQHPGDIWQDTATSGYVYRKAGALYRRLQMPNMLYDDVVERAKGTLFLVLAVIYLLAVLLLELIVMPTYVYRPLRLMLAADRATRAGDRAGESIPERFITGDEIGNIMRSRNDTVADMRRHEDELAEALHHLELVAADLKLKNEQLENARRTISEQDRLVSLGLLSASVAHEMNTPLAVLHGSIEKLLETVTDRSAIERLRRMHRVTERLRRISESLLDFARVRRQATEPVEVRPIIDEAWSLVAIDEKASEVSFLNCVSAGHTVVGNADRLVQLFVNLLRNALHAVAQGGVVSVCSRSMSRGGENWISIDVDDNGPGIPADVLPDIFEAFVTTRLDARGTGLGLTVAEGIVDQHGGTIAATNRPEGGARLEVVLRAAGQDAARV